MGLEPAILKRNRLKGTPKPRYRAEPVSINPNKDNPKSISFEPPLKGKNGVWTLTTYWLRVSGVQQVPQRLLPYAKALLAQWDWERACRIVKWYAPRKYSLRWLSENSEIIKKEFGW